LLADRDDLLGAHQSLQVSGVNHATVDGEFTEGIVDLAGGKLVTEGHEGVSEGLSVNFAIDFKSFKGLEDGFVVVSAAGHLGGEEGDHLGEVHGSVNLIEHSLCLSATNVLSVSAEGGDEVGGGEKSILVSVHDAEGLLELLDGRVGEGVEDVSFLGHGGVGGGAGGS